MIKIVFIIKNIQTNDNELNWFVSLFYVFSSLSFLCIETKRTKTNLEELLLILQKGKTNNMYRQHRHFSLFFFN